MTPAESLARRAHAGQLDKAGQPYVGHLERVVANLLRRWPDALRAALAGLERDSCCAECAAYAALCCLQLGRPHEALAWALAAKAVASVDTPVRGPWRHPAAYGRGPDAIAEAARKVIAEVTANGA